MNEESTKLSGCLNRIGTIYQSIAIMFLTTVLFLVGFEVTIATYRAFRNVVTPEKCIGYADCPENLLKLPYYQDKDWAEEFWDTPQPPARFHPYSLWHTETNEDKYRNFDEQGFRITPNVQCDEGAYHIYMFGGSTTWGDGTPDWGTIPAYLQNMFNDTDQMICMHNMGQRAFHATQEVVELTNQLQLGVRPDMVIFYDGINEIGNMIEMGEPWLPSSILRRLLWEDVDPFVKLVSATNTYTFLIKYFKSPYAKPPVTRYSDEKAEQLMQQTIDIYINNYHIVEALSKQFDFEFKFFWQPTIAYKKPLTEDEQSILEMYVPRMGPLYFEDNMEVILSIHQRMEEMADDFDHLVYIGDAYEQHSGQLYFDIWHVTPEGNEIVAREIFDVVGSIP